ncbi:MAG: PDZ domain-containing protein [Planctomycetota bacterium]
MLILPKRKSTFNFFESFSDLVFCTLVMFLVLVLFLAMNVNQKQEQVESDQQAVTLTRAEIEQARIDAERELAEQQRLRDEAKDVFDREMARVEAQRKEIIDKATAAIAAERKRIEEERQRINKELRARQDALAVMEREVDRQVRVYQQALGTNRFTGLPAKPRLVVAYDWQDNRIGIHPVPAWLVDELNTTPPGLAGQPLADYYASLRAKFMEQVNNAKALTPTQYRALIRAVSVGLEPVPRVGNDRRMSLDLEFIVDEDGQTTTQVGVAIPGGNGESAGIRAGDTVIAVGDESVTPDTLVQVLARYQAGDRARILVRRGGKPVGIDLTFRELRVVELIEAYRTDLSMVVSGAVDTDYTYLWAPARADNLRGRLQRGVASQALWQGASRWEGRTSIEGRPALRFDAAPSGDEVMIGEERFSLGQFRRILEALGGGGVVVEYAAKEGPRDLPDWLYEGALRPTGFVIRAPQLDKLLEQAE